MSDRFFQHPEGFDVDLLLWQARERDRLEILEAIGRLPDGEPHHLALSPALARVLEGEPIQLPTVVDPELVSFGWELRPAR